MEIPPSPCPCYESPNDSGRRLVGRVKSSITFTDRLSVIELILADSAQLVEMYESRRSASWSSRRDAGNGASRSRSYRFATPGITFVAICSMRAGRGH